MMTRRVHGQQGFTLTELLVVMFVVSLLSAFTIPNWRQGNKNLALERSAHTVAQDIRRAGELALSAQVTACPGSGAISGYGFYASLSAPSSYILFAECTGNMSYDENQDVIVGGIATPLESGIEISALTPSPFTVVFIPPIPTVTIGNGAVSVGTITLQVQGDAARTRTITVTDKGLIDSE